MEDIFKALDKYLEDTDKSDIPGILETVVIEYTKYADVDIDWIEI